MLRTNGRFARSMQSVMKSSGGVVVITDFDRTLTKYMGPDGGEGDQCHEIIFKHASQAPSWAAEVRELYQEADLRFGG
jgi:hypothetical protein